jgi:menaquinol-cytochrome c reductase iron-sulfur subunit
MKMPKAETTRRGFLTYLTELLLLTIGILMAIPAVAYLSAPVRRRPGDDAAEPNLSDAGPLADIPLDQWHLVALDIVRQDGWKKTRVKQSVWVRRDGASEQAIRILSPICPHLGCPVNWHTDQKEFKCPCHGGIFDVTGKHVAGPPPRNMDPLLDFKVLNGHLWIRWQDFKIGVSECIPVSV